MPKDNLGQIIFDEILLEASFWNTDVAEHVGFDERPVDIQFGVRHTYVNCYFTDSGMSGYYEIIEKANGVQRFDVDTPVADNPLICSKRDLERALMHIKPNKPKESEADDE